MRSPKQLIVTSTLGAIAITAFLIACDKRADASRGTPTVAASGVAAAKSSAGNDRYHVELKPIGSYERGKEGFFELLLETKADFHVNEEFPAKLKLEREEGASYAKKMIAIAGGELLLGACTAQHGGAKFKCSMTARVAFTPKASGAVTVGGGLVVGVCNASSCVIERPKLELTVNVK